MSEGKIVQLRRERDEAKRQYDDVMRQRESFIGDLDTVMKALGRAQDALQAALPYGDVDGAQAARQRLAELRTRREELLSMIAGLGQRQSLLQRQFGDCHDRWRHAEEDATWMKNRIAVRRQQLAKYVDTEEGPAIDAIRTDLEQCLERYRDLTGEYLPEETSAAA